MTLHDIGLPTTDDFTRTLATIEQGLTVSLIATPSPKWFDQGTPARPAIEEMRQKDFTQAVVRRGDSAVGVLFDNGVPVDEQSVGGLAVPFEDWMLVSAASGLRDILTGLAQENRRFRLVLGSNGVEGIVTRSDIHKLPVRMFLFSLVTHLEYVLGSLLTDICTEQEWLNILKNGVMPKNAPEHVRGAISGKIGPDVEKNLKKLQNRNRKRGIAPDLIEVTDFGHKWFAVGQELRLGAKFRSDMASIQKFVRNRVMHQAKYVMDDKAIDELVKRMRYIEYWLTELAKRKQKYGQHA